MDEVIRLTEQHMTDCQINQEFKEANDTKQKLLQMKTIRDLIEREEIGDTYKVGEERIEFQTKIAIEEVN